MTDLATTTAIAPGWVEPGQQVQTSCLRYVVLRCCPTTHRAVGLLVGARHVERGWVGVASALEEVLFQSGSWSIVEP